MTTDKKVRNRNKAVKSITIQNKPNETEEIIVYANPHTFADMLAEGKNASFSAAVFLPHKQTHTGGDGDGTSFSLSNRQNQLLFRLFPSSSCLFFALFYCFLSFRFSFFSFICFVFFLLLAVAVFIFCYYFFFVFFSKNKKSVLRFERNRHCFAPRFSSISSKHNCLQTNQCTERFAKNNQKLIPNRS